MHFPLVSASWLAQHSQDPNLVILDVSLPNNQAGLKPQYPHLRIPKARFFDLKNDFCDLEASIPNTMPSPASFAKQARLLGINCDSKIVVYDNMGIYYSPRVWWMFRVMGHSNIAVLDGGLPAWVEAGFSTESKENTLTPTLGNFEANYQASLICDKAAIVKHLQAPKGILIDARSPARYKGDIPEKRAHLKKGHIPSALNIPYEWVLENGQFKTQQNLKKLFEQQKVLDQSLITVYCGSGTTACIILLAFELISNQPKCLYDGSWSEWGALKDSPIE